MSVPIVPTVPEGGNTISPSGKKKIKTVNPAKRWCFTLNNYTEEEICSIVPIVCDKCNIGIIAKECGESGTPHLQGYIEFKTKTRPLTHFKTKRIHWEKCKGNRQSNIDYCSKEGNVILYHGIEEPYTLELPNLYEWEEYVLNILKEEPNDRHIHWIWEEDGNAGKTTFCKYVYLHHKDAILLSGKADNMKHAIIQFKETNNRLPKIILIDIPRSTDLGYLSYQGIEEIKNMFFYSGKYEGGMVCGKPPHLFIFANEPPNTFKCSSDRWVIKNI